MVFSHRTLCRKLVSSQATRPVSGARCQTATFDAWRPHRYGLAFQVLPLAGSPRHCQAGDVYQMASNCFSRVLEMEVSEIRPTTAAKESADAHLADGLREPDLGRRGIRVSPRTVGKYLKRRGRYNAGDAPAHRAKASSLPSTAFQRRNPKAVQSKLFPMILQVAHQPSTVFGVGRKPYVRVGHYSPSDRYEPQGCVNRVV